VQKPHENKQQKPYKEKGICMKNLDHLVQSQWQQIDDNSKKNDEVILEPERRPTEREVLTLILLISGRLLPSKHEKLGRRTTL